MTRRDFVLMSKAIRQARNHILISDGPAMAYRLDGLAIAARRIAINIAEVTPGFDSERFLIDCGVLDEQF